MALTGTHAGTTVSVASASGPATAEVSSRNLISFPVVATEANDMSCPTPDVCYLASVPVMKSTDGGASWAVVGPQTYPVLSFVSIDCFDAQRCVGFDTSNFMYRTQDAGANWSSVQISTTRSNNGRGACTSWSTCVVSVPDGNATLMRSTNDGGLHWVEVYLDSGYAPDEVECDPSGLCVLRTTDRVYRSLDAGASWSKVLDTSTRALDCPGGGSCYGVGVFGLTRVTATSVTPGLASPPIGPIFTAVACPDAMRCAALSPVIPADNVAGVMWSEGVVSAPTITFSGDPTTPLVADCAGTVCTALAERNVYPHADSAVDHVMRSTNGGLTWTELAPPAPVPRVSDLSCGTSNNCVWVGRSGVHAARLMTPQGGQDDVFEGAAAYTTDGGVSWSPSSLPAGTRSILRVRCGPGGLCMAAAQTSLLEGGLIRSTDGGAHWSAVALPVQATTATVLACVTPTRCVVSIQTAPAPSAQSSLLVTDNAGATWTVAWHGDGAIGQGECTEAAGCVVVRIGSTFGSPATMLRSPDFGTTWSEVAAPETSQVPYLTLLGCGPSRCFLVNEQTYHGWTSDDAALTWQPWDPTFATPYGDPIHRLPYRTMDCVPSACFTGASTENGLMIADGEGTNWSAMLRTDSPALGQRIICGGTDRCFVLDTLPGVRQLIRRLDVAPRAFAALSPGRLLDTRSGPGLTTVDHQFEAVGTIAPGTSIELPVVGRAGVPADAATVALNVTVTEPSSAGYVTVYPCGDSPPLASNVNFTAGQTVANAVIGRVGVGGAVCLFSSARTHLVVDVNGAVPGGVSSVNAIVPQRILETRRGTPYRTIDGRDQGIGARHGGTTFELQVAGRGSIPVDASSAVLNLTVTEPAAAGYLTAFPCDGAPPLASNVNYVAGQTAANGVVAKLSPRGTVCLFTMSTTELVVDVNGYLPAAVTSLTALPPARLLETRAGPGMDTIDHHHLGEGPIERTVYVLDVAGRGGVGLDADSVLLNVTVTEPHGPGYVTLYPCAGLPPLASNLNFVTGETRANSAVVRLASTGVVCAYTSARTQLVIDVVGYWR